MDDERDAAAERAIQGLLRARGKDRCPTCGRRLDRGDVAWNEGEGETGTPLTTVWIRCLACDTEIASAASWQGAEDLEEVAELLRRERWEE